MGWCQEKNDAGIALPSTTALFSSDGSEAELVRAQADSNWMRLETTVNSGKEGHKFWVKPAWKMLSIESPLFTESNFWADWRTCSYISKLLLFGL